MLASCLANTTESQKRQSIMAEILGVVASVAGLACLSLQINDSIGRLGATRAAVRTLPAQLNKIERRLEFLETVRRIVADRSRIVSKDHTTLIQTCEADYEAILQRWAPWKPKSKNLRTGGFAMDFRGPVRSCWGNIETLTSVSLRLTATLRCRSVPDSNA
ncbi:hypothetical protein B0T25DRAFT_53609 [Lasiosphaeria hispida]|uniref:Fungal N-terminal domain-containing protein n=1 Tax=Lasiosphaeria hispida TaxID=260671 RepID=A0AAJ0MKF6_9PEZI|nr:hypothetical protein B0T25DRAFT_53609 [Lasiosphaeria hispida]